MQETQQRTHHYDLSGKNCTFIFGDVQQITGKVIDSRIKYGASVRVQHQIETEDQFMLCTGEFAKLFFVNDTDVLSVEGDDASTAYYRGKFQRRQR